MTSSMKPRVNRRRPSNDFTGKIRTQGGSVIWYKNGQIHRDNGPAAEFSDGKCDWYFQGDFFIFDDYCLVAEISDEDKMMLKLKYGV